METKSPNLFYFATSELSQDAFIAWLISWADPKYAVLNNALHLTGIELLDALFDKIGHSRPQKYDSVKVELQVKHIDVLVTINNSIPLIIEDKTFTSDHSTQLTDYVETVSKDFRIKPDEVPAIYFKTGDQSNYGNAQKAGYKVFGRGDFLGILQSGIERGITSDIFRDFFVQLRQLENEVESYLTTPVKDWQPGWNGWVGFFKLLQERLGTGEWGYVPNVKGGFMCFYWNSKDHRYLQIEETKLCFKIEVPEVDQQSSEWHKWNSQLMKAPNAGSISLQRPARRRNGRWMTVAVVENYLKETSGGFLDMKATIEVLRKAEEVMAVAAAD